MIEYQFEAPESYVHEDEVFPFLDEYADIVAVPMKDEPILPAQEGADKGIGFVNFLWSLILQDSKDPIELLCCINNRPRQSDNKDRNLKMAVFLSKLNQLLGNPPASTNFDSETVHLTEAEMFATYQLAEACILTGRKLQIQVVDRFSKDRCHPQSNVGYARRCLEAVAIKRACASNCQIEEKGILFTDADSEWSANTITTHKIALLEQEVTGSKVKRTCTEINADAVRAIEQGNIRWPINWLVYSFLKSYRGFTGAYNESDMFPGHTISYRLSSEGIVMPPIPGHEDVAASRIKKAQFTELDHHGTAFVPRRISTRTSENSGMGFGALRDSEIRKMHPHTVHVPHPLAAYCRFSMDHALEVNMSYEDFVKDFPHMKVYVDEKTYKALQAEWHQMYPDTSSNWDYNRYYSIRESLHKIYHGIQSDLPTMSIDEVNAFIETFPLPKNYESFPKTREEYEDKRRDFWKKSVKNIWDIDINIDEFGLSPDELTLLKQARNPQSIAKITEYLFGPKLKALDEEKRQERIAIAKRINNSIAGYDMTLAGIMYIILLKASCSNIEEAMNSIACMGYEICIANDEVWNLRSRIVGTRDAWHVKKLDDELVKKGASISRRVFGRTIESKTGPNTEIKNTRESKILKWLDQIAEEKPMPQPEIEDDTFNEYLKNLSKFTNRLLIKEAMNKYLNEAGKGVIVDCTSKANEATSLFNKINWTERIIISSKTDGFDDTAEERVHLQQRSLHINAPLLETMKSMKTASINCILIDETIAPEKRAAFWKEARRALKPDGVLIVDTCTSGVEPDEGNFAQFNLFNKLIREGDPEFGVYNFSVEEESHSSNIPSSSS